MNIEEITFEFFTGKNIGGIIIDVFLVFIIIMGILSFALRVKKAISFIIPTILIAGIYFISYYFELKACSIVIKWVLIYYPIFVIVVLGPDIARYIEQMKHVERKVIDSHNLNDNTKNQIADAIFDELSPKKIGAIITLEKNVSLDQYVEHSILMNSDVSKEILINIFIPNTPLHDGAVIIRGNKIRCAGAYYRLTTQDVEDKTMGSRHRAALGISENSDSITIIASEETGNVSIAYEGVMIPMENKGKLNEYLTMFLK